MPDSIDVKLFGPLRETASGNRLSVEVEGPLAINELLNIIREDHPDLIDSEQHLAVAINQEIIENYDTVVSPEDEVGLLPPFGGGLDELPEWSLIRFEQSPEDFSLDELISFVSSPDNGGIATFSGTIRSTNQQKPVDYLEYECYETMARETLQTIHHEANNQWNDRGQLRIASAHRTGKVRVGQPAVLIAVGAPHRAEALEACRYVIDELKSRVPLWKKEVYSSGETWIENPESTPSKNHPDSP